MSCVLFASSALTSVAPDAAAKTRVTLKDQFNAYPVGSTWADNQSFGPWAVVFAGYGAVSVARRSLLRLRPAAAESPVHTHSALVVSNQIITTPKLDLRSKLRTTQQLRTGSTPNPWEVAWLIWDYQDNDHFSYLAIKTNGWELGKRDPAYPGGQRFLATGTNRATAVGKWRKVRIKRKLNPAGHAVIKAFYGSKRLTCFVDSERPYSVGKIGFYTEDAVIDVDSAKVQ